MKRRIANKIAKQSLDMKCRKNWRAATVHKAILRAGFSSWYNSPVASAFRMVIECLHHLKEQPWKELIK